MKSSISFLILLALPFLFGACNEDDNKDTPPDPADPKLVLRNISVLDSLNKQIQNTEIHYKGDKISDIKVISEGELFKQRDGFEFDDEGRIVAYRETRPDDPDPTLDLKLSYNENGLASIKQFRTSNGTLKTTIDIEHDGDQVTTIRKDENGGVDLQRIATYDELGNVGKLVVTGTSDTLFTVDFFNYDEHPNTLEELFFQVGDEEALLPSKNNPGFSVVKNQSGSTTTNELSYEYNSDGLPVKKTFNNLSLRFLFGYTELF